MMYCSHFAARDRESLGRLLGPELLLPAASARLSFRSVEPDGSGARAWVSAKPFGPDLPGFFLPASQMQGSIGPIAGLRQHGDYDGIATLPTGALSSGATFFPTWSRSDGAMGAASVVDGSLVTVTP